MISRILITYLTIFFASFLNAFHGTKPSINGKEQYLTDVSFNEKVLQTITYGAHDYDCNQIAQEIKKYQQKIELPLSIYISTLLRNYEQKYVSDIWKQMHEKNAKKAIEIRNLINHFEILSKPIVLAPLIFHPTIDITTQINIISWFEQMRTHVYWLYLNENKPSSKVTPSRVGPCDEFEQCKFDIALAASALKKAIRSSEFLKKPTIPLYIKTSSDYLHRVDFGITEKVSPCAQITLDTDWSSMSGNLRRALTHIYEMHGALLPTAYLSSAAIPALLLQNHARARQIQHRITDVLFFADDMDRLYDQKYFWFNRLSSSEKMIVQKKDIGELKNLYSSKQSEALGTCAGNQPPYAMRYMQSKTLLTIARFLRRL